MTRKVNKIIMNIFENLPWKSNNLFTYAAKFSTFNKKINTFLIDESCQFNVENQPMSQLLSEFYKVRISIL